MKVTSSGTLFTGSPHSYDIPVTAAGANTVVGSFATYTDSTLCPTTMVLINANDSTEYNQVSNDHIHINSNDIEVNTNTRAESTVKFKVSSTGYTDWISSSFKISSQCISLANSGTEATTHNGNVPTTTSSTWVEIANADSIWPVVSQVSVCPREFKMFLSGSEVTRTAIDTDEVDFVDSLKKMIINPNRASSGSYTLKMKYTFDTTFLEHGIDVNVVCNNASNSFTMTTPGNSHTQTALITNPASPLPFEVSSLTKT